VNKEMKAYNILVVDDDMSIRECFKEILSEAGNYQVDTTGNPQQALEKLKGNAFDIVISDIVMPKMDGIEFLQEIKAIDSTLPVVMITGLPTVDTAIRAMKEGASDFITKPLRFDQITLVAEKLIRERKLLLENAQLHDALQQKQTIEALNTKLNQKIKEISILYSISESFLETFVDDERLYAKITQMATEITGASFSMLMLMDRERKVLIPEAKCGLAGYTVANQISYLQPDLNAILLDQSPYVIRHSPTNPREIGIMDESFRCSALVFLPLTIQGEKFCILTVGDTNKKRKFGEADVALLQSLAQKASLNIENKILYESIYENMKDTLHSLVAAVEARDSYTLSHSIRVTQLSLEIAKRMGSSQEDLDILNFSGYLHDIGKIGISDIILLKEGRLTDDEYEVVKTHPVIGENILQPLGLMPLEKSIIRHHHERWDGKGYPDGLRGEEIPLLSRIIAVADAYDAMSQDRPYRKALQNKDTILELKRCVDQFDSDVVEAFLEFLFSQPEERQIFDLH
jgi:putative nucleotidyltransferase with HDIG domain